MHGQGKRSCIMQYGIRLYKTQNIYLDGTEYQEIGNIGRRRVGVDPFPLLHPITVEGKI